MSFYGLFFISLIIKENPSNSTGISPNLGKRWRLCDFVGIRSPISPKFVWKKKWACHIASMRLLRRRLWPLLVGWIKYDLELNANAGRQSNRSQHRGTFKIIVVCVCVFGYAYYKDKAYITRVVVFLLMFFIFNFFYM